MIRQGHTYQDTRTGAKVMDMESGDVVRVREVEPGADWLGHEYVAASEWLQALPMVYFRGEVPA